MRRLLTKARPGLLAAVVVLASLLQGCAPDPAKGVFDEAEGLYADGMHASAIERYSEVVKKHQASPLAPRSQYRIASIYRTLGATSRAMDEYSALLYIFPESTEAADVVRDMSEIYSTSGDHAKAVSGYEKYIRLRPSERQAFRLRIAEEYVKMNDLRQARVELLDLYRTSMGQTRRRVAFDLASVYHVEGDSAEAERYYDAVIDKDVEDGLHLDALLGKARLREEKGDVAEAKVLLRTLLEKHPNSQAIKARLEWIDRRDGYKEKPVRATVEQ